MEEQKLTEICVKALEKVAIVEDRKERIKTAADFADRLFIADYFSRENRTNFVKNELASYFELTDEETANILETIKNKEQRVNDKLQISKLKEGLKYVEIYENNLLFEGFNLRETKKIVDYIDNEYNINDKQILKKFILDSLCAHFELNSEEIEEIKRFCEERGIVE